MSVVSGGAEHLLDLRDPFGDAGEAYDGHAQLDGGGKVGSGVVDEHALIRGYTDPAAVRR